MNSGDHFPTSSIFVNIFDDCAVHRTYKAMRVQFVESTSLAARQSHQLTDSAAETAASQAEYRRVSEGPLVSVRIRLVIVHVDNLRSDPGLNEGCEWHLKDLRMEGL
jgi:hypothetical protein